MRKFEIQNPRVGLSDVEETEYPDDILPSPRPAKRELKKAIKSTDEHQGKISPIGPFIRLNTHLYNHFYPFNRGLEKDVWHDVAI